jgi:two-component system alkaline phosphatase synthesis response regulator PhoP
MQRILIVEDEPTIKRISEGEFDLILLDVMLPGADGFTVCREARMKGIRTPIVMLTAKGQEVDKVVGLELGADDYVTKPFSPRELLARIKAVMRRSRDEPKTANSYHFADITVDFDRFELLRKGEKIDLTAMEFKLLRAFLDHRGQVLTIDELLREIWGKDVYLTDRVIYTHVNNLRSKIEEDPRNPKLLVSVRGIGYRFDG